MKAFRLRAVLFSFLPILILGRTSDAAAGQAQKRQVAGPSGLEQLLDETYRIDIDQIDVVFDWFPASSVAESLATLTFRMRPGQSRAVFHFAPFLEDRGMVTGLELDGEALNPRSEADVAVIGFSGTNQKAFEVRRSLTEGPLHTLRLRYMLALPDFYPRFSAEVNDLMGHGNERFFPTLNTPAEQARHRLTFRVHGGRAFLFVGTGNVTPRTEGGVQEWVLDTGFPVSSYTVMFALIPADDGRIERRRIGGIDVSILAFNDLDLGSVWGMLDKYIPTLQADLGPFPAPWGLRVFAVKSGWGMEYLGGTICVNVAGMSHEIFHSYFGCSVTWLTYRDSWLDEAIASWLDDHYDNLAVAPIADDYRANWVGARSPVSVGFSNFAYTDGKQIIQAVADRLGGRTAMMGFLRYLYQRWAFEPLDTFGFLEILHDYSGIDLSSRFLSWLYDGQDAFGAVRAVLNRASAGGVR